MIYGILADIVVLVHAAFVLFAVFGGFLVLRWRRLAWLHIPAVLWAALVEMAGWICPLTPLENLLRHRAGKVIYRSDFIEHYMMPVLYPAALTRELQMALGLAVLFINVSVYVWVWHRRRPL
ncbi:MAG: DUF2784 domain-containing protein [Syntrophobacterales bacterium CG03_land_8_20_14_0_80_58_14]|nr:MAG: hypothetical protein AUK26_03630 [Syntrophaceae bacterium CG2_30_58_14]PIV06037.1 MAG: DUF2784 domain-containing protein [Syntrophobacterales bacterium CG03_land_8_20_14_0_80_58_14]